MARFVGEGGQGDHIRDPISGDIFEQESVPESQPVVVSRHEAGQGKRADPLRRGALHRP